MRTKIGVCTAGLALVVFSLLPLASIPSSTNLSVRPACASTDTMVSDPCYKSCGKKKGGTCEAGCTDWEYIVYV